MAPQKYALASGTWAKMALRLGALAVGILLSMAPVNSRAEEQLVVRREGDVGGEVILGQAELEALEQVTIHTSTPWTTGIRSFRGPSLKTVIEHLHIQASSLRLVALNDYSAEISLQDIGPDYPIVATRIDDLPIPVRENGPFWIIFPYDSDPKFRTEIVYGQSVWQLSGLTAIPK